ncbi:MAG TPA: lipoprotein [Dokdonella sp.]|nr:lipoprotein [Dokdonella sp.]HNR90965.1 lipoprotein [Dokdonella sp.]
MRRSLRPFALILLALLAACGNKGDLVKPQPDTPRAATTAAG